MSLTLLSYSHLPISKLIPTSDHYFGTWLRDIVLMSKSGMTLGYVCTRVDKPQTTYLICPWTSSTHMNFNCSPLTLPNHLGISGLHLYPYLSSGNLSSNTLSFDHHMLTPLSFLFLYFSTSTITKLCYYVEYEWFSVLIVSTQRKIK